jgi:hypothetical protein
MLNVLVIDHSPELRNEIALGLTGAASVATFEPHELAFIGATLTVHRPAVLLIGDVGRRKKAELIRDLRRRSSRSRIIVMGAAHADEVDWFLQLGACCVLGGAATAKAIEKVREYLSYGPRTTGLIDRRNGIVRDVINDEASSGSHRQ